MSSAEDIGYAPVIGYEVAVGETCAWLREAKQTRDWREVLPDLARYPSELFDYRAEDDYIANPGAGSTARLSVE